MNINQSQKTLSIAFLAIVVICFAYGAWWTVGRKEATPTQTNPSANNKSQTNQTPQTAITYDAKTTIPNTGITFSYPRDGFNGKGISIEKNERSVLDVFESIANYYVSALPSGTPQISINIYALKNEKTLDEALKTIGDQMTDLSLGHRQNINGTEYYLVPSDASSEIYTGYAIIKNQLLAITFDSISVANPKNTTPEFVTDFLSHMDYSCESDCSVNSATVTETQRGEN